MTTKLSALTDRLDGQRLFPGDDGFDSARAVWNAMIDRRPRLIVRCTNVDDVVTAIRAARELDLEIGVRCGGHSVLGLCVPEDGLMIDLTPMSSVRVDPEQRRAWVQGGALLGALDIAAQEHGLVINAPNDETIRLVPALTIGDVELDEFVELFTASVRTVEDALLLENPTEVHA